MKLAPRTFQIFWDVHAWAGMVASLLLVLIFFMGAFALFFPELDAWAEGDGGAVDTATPPLNPLLAQLMRQSPALAAEQVAFMPGPAGLNASAGEGEARRWFRYAARDGRLEPTHSRLGSFLYELHYLGPIPNAIYLAGIASGALLLTLLTGLFVHLKDLIRHWFQVRSHRPARTWASDVHKVLGVFGLPYQILYAWTGLVLCLGFVTVEPVFRAAMFRGDRRAAAAARGPGAGAPTQASAVPDPTVNRQDDGSPDVDALLAGASRQVPGLRPTWIGLSHPREPQASIDVYGRVDGVLFGIANVVLRARDGAVLRSAGPAGASSYQRFEAWFFGLHYAHFGGVGVKLLYALLALGTAVVLVTGNIVWLERRDRARSRRGNRLLERLTIGWCTGLLVATAALFLANRLLPAPLVHRVALEQTCFWAVWALAVVAAGIWPSVRDAARGQLAAAALVFAVVPSLDVITRPARLKDAAHVGVNVALLAMALVCGAAVRAGWLRGRAPARGQPSGPPGPPAEPWPRTGEA